MVCLAAVLSTVLLFESSYLANNGFFWDGETDNLVCIEQWTAIGQFALRKY